MGWNTPWVTAWRQTPGLGVTLAPAVLQREEVLWPWGGLVPLLPFGDSGSGGLQGEGPAESGQLLQRRSRQGVVVGMAGRQWTLGCPALGCAVSRATGNRSKSPWMVRVHPWEPLPMEQRGSPPGCWPLPAPKECIKAA